MGFSKTKNKEIIKTYSFKVRNCSDQKLVDDAILEYNRYYNKTSEWIRSNLVTNTIGGIASLLDEKYRKSEYYKNSTNDENKGKPLYKAFLKGFSDMDATNLLMCAVKAVNADDYHGNPIGVSDSYYRLTYIRGVCANYKTKFDSFAPKVKRKKIKWDSTDDEKNEQCIYEMTHEKITKPHEMKDKLDYLKMKMDVKPKTLERLEILYAHFKDNESGVMEAYNRLTVESLVKFDGCKRKNLYSGMNLQFNKYNITRKDGCSGYIVELPIGKNKLTFDIYGRKDTTTDSDDIVDICKCHTTNIVIKKVKGELYLDIPVKIKFKKDEPSTSKYVGIDVNTKHAMLVTSLLDDGSLKGYANLYKIVSKDKEFMSLADTDTKMAFESLSNVVTFAPIEYSMLYSHIICSTDKMKLAESRFEKVLKDYARTADTEVRIYIQTLLRFRNSLKRYLYWKDIYTAEQMAYDLRMGFVDESTESKETMDKRRKESPFISDPKGAQLSAMLNEIEKKIAEQEGNLILYTYKVLLYNGYNIPVMEDLSASSFKRTRYFPTIDSLLKFHKLLGKKRNEINECKAYAEHKDKYKLIFDENDEVSGAEYTKEATVMNEKARARDIIIKAIHFADIKNTFAKYANNNDSAVIFVPSYYTSLMDSNIHKLYMVEDEKGKLKLPNKKTIRPIQEQHKNGLNCDINAARNILYIAENREWFERLCMKNNDYGYSEPMYKPRVKKSHTTLKEYKALGAIEVIGKV